MDYNKKIRDAIKNIIKLYKKEPFRILSKSDMKCWLFHFLIDKKEFNVYENKEVRKTYLIHSETHVGRDSWVDIYIFKVPIEFNRSERTEGYLQKWKFNNDDADFTIAIELKYNYNNVKTDVEKKIELDMVKFNKSSIDDKYFVMFDHRGTLLKKEFEHLIKDNIKAIYIDGFRRKVYSKPSFY